MLEEKLCMVFVDDGFWSRKIREGAMVVLLFNIRLWLVLDLLNEKGSWVVMGGVYPMGVVVNSGLVVVVWNC
jgi:hypothetical protein